MLIACSAPGAKARLTPPCARSRNADPKNKIPAKRALITPLPRCFRFWTDTRIGIGQGIGLWSNTPPAPNGQTVSHVQPKRGLGRVPKRKRVARQCWLSERLPNQLGDFLCAVTIEWRESSDPSKKENPPAVLSFQNSRFAVDTGSSRRAQSMTVGCMHLVYVVLTIRQRFCARDSLPPLRSAICPFLEKSTDSPRMRAASCGAWKPVEFSASTKSR